MMGPLEWKAYLQECSHQMIVDDNAGGGWNLPQDVVGIGWLGYAPASESAIRQAESRLGITLPPSLRTFYSVTNGWRTVGNFIWNVLPVEKIGWLADLQPNLWEDAATLGENEVDYEQGTRVWRSLVASDWADCDASTWLLDPGTINGKGEWASGRWSSWNPGMEWIADSFEELFQDEYETYLRLRTET